MRLCFLDNAEFPEATDNSEMKDLTDGRQPPVYHSFSSDDDPRLFFTAPSPAPSNEPDTHYTACVKALSWCGRYLYTTLGLLAFSASCSFLGSSFLRASTGDKARYDVEGAVLASVFGTLGILTLLPCLAGSDQAISLGQRFFRLTPPLKFLTLLLGLPTFFVLTSLLGSAAELLLLDDEFSLMSRFFSAALSGVFAAAATGVAVGFLASPEAGEQESLTYS